MSRTGWVVTVASVILGLLLLAAAVVLWQQYTQYEQADQDLDKFEAEVKRLYKLNPYPVATNVTLEAGNLQVLNSRFDQFMETLASGQVEPEKKTPSMFIDYFWRTQKELHELARSHGVGVAKDFPFGFAKYLPGTPPDPDDVARLFQQRNIVIGLCGILCASKIGELSRIACEEFDAGAVGASASSPAPGRPGRPSRPEGEVSSTPSPSAQPSAGVMGEQDLRAKFHFNLEFKASEAVFLTVLNEMAKSRMFIVVTDVSMISEDVRAMHAVRPVSEEEALKSGPAAPAAKTTSTKDDRIVAGREKPILVRMGVDVYWFRKPADSKAPDQEPPGP